jgi:hypothetical protein
MCVQRAGQNANTATINTKSNVATAISMTPNWGESLVMNQLVTNPATISAPRASQLNMIVSCYTGVFNAHRRDCADSIFAAARTNHARLFFPGSNGLDYDHDARQSITPS